MLEKSNASRNKKPERRNETPAIQTLRPEKKMKPPMIFLKMPKKKKKIMPNSTLC